MKVLIPAIVLILLNCSCSFLPKQDATVKNNPWHPSYRIMFWNTENLFDIYDDSLTMDDEFTPYGIRAWNAAKYQLKINNMYKVLVAAGNPDPPEIIALCEVENRKVLYDLTVDSPFGKFGYKILHRDSKDSRGIDVAVIYNPERIRILYKDFISPLFLASSGKTTRDIVYLKARIHEKDTMHFFFCHCPSKYGGAGYTEPKRKEVALELKHHVDSILKKERNAAIIIGGDFNDPPSSESVSHVLHAYCYENQDSICSTNLYNLSCFAKPGTYKNQGIWETIDQFIVSGTLIQIRSSNTERLCFEIFAPYFLMETDEKFAGLKPFRTWEGMKFKGGFSDHLPVILNVY